jgi:hypothetical protein
MASGRAGLYVSGWNGAGQLGTGGKMDFFIRSAQPACPAPARV